MTAFIGIDPGQSGAISVIWDDGTAASQFHRLSLSEHDAADFIRGFDMTNAKAVIESVHSMPKQGVASSFKFGRSFGFCIGLLTGLQIPYKLVTPSIWQRDMQCRTKGDKNVSKAAAQRLWPAIKITHANADSLLLAEWGRIYGWK